VVKASSWESEGRGSNLGTTKQRLTSACIKQQNIPKFGVPFNDKIGKPYFRLKPRALLICAEP